MGKKLDEITANMRRIIEESGFECVGFELAAEEGMKVLRVYVDKAGALSLDDCETIARSLNEFLDEKEQELPVRYFLEVSSPGLERPLFTLEDYERFQGKEAQLSLAGQKKPCGVILGVCMETASVRLKAKDGTERDISFADIKKGRLIYVPETDEKKTFKKIAKKKKK